MAYKDKDKQREAVKAATRRYRAKKGDSAIPGQKQGLKKARGLPVVDEVGDTQPVIPSCDTPTVIPKQGITENAKATDDYPDAEAIEWMNSSLGPKPLPANFGQADCACRHCRANRANGSKLEINHGPYKGCKDLIKGEVNRVALPGDVDYEGVGHV
jgi:hypothetical protein